MRLLALLLLISCASGTSMVPERNYKYDMKVKVDGKVYEGVGVLQEKPVGQYSFVGETAGRIDLFTLVTCSKYLSKEKAWGDLQTDVAKSLWDNILRNTHKVSFMYSRNSLERRLSVCQLYLEALEKEKGRHSQALFDIEDSKHTLKAMYTCNIETKPSNGVTMCQNKNGNYMTLAFDNPTKCINDCNEYDIEKRVHDIKLPEGKCIWICKYKDLYHRLTTYGFEEKALR